MKMYKGVQRNELFLSVWSISIWSHPQKIYFCINCCPNGFDNFSHRHTLAFTFLPRPHLLSTCAARSLTSSLQVCCTFPHPDHYVGLNFFLCRFSPFHSVVHFSKIFLTRRGSIPLWVLPSAYTIFLFSHPGLYPLSRPPTPTPTPRTWGGG